MGRILSGSVANILDVFRQADAIDLREGLNAYENYNRTLRRIAVHYSIGMEQTVGAFCALSPNNDWVGNLRSLVSCIEGVRAGKKDEEITISTYHACRTRALRCIHADADFLHFTRGPKTRSFYLNICFPESNEPVTIDGHMVGVWSKERMTMKEVAETRFNYAAVAGDFRRAAFRLQLRPNQVQAVCWFVWKRINKVLFNPQLGMFAGHDQWGLLWRPEDIKPFSFKEVEDAGSSNSNQRHSIGRLSDRAPICGSDHGAIHHVQDSPVSSIPRQLSIFTDMAESRHCDLAGSPACVPSLRSDNDGASGNGERNSICVQASEPYRAFNHGGCI